MCTVPKPYPKEFRDDVVNVARSREPGQTIKQIAADFGIAGSCLPRHRVVLYPALAPRGNEPAQWPDRAMHTTDPLALFRRPPAGRPRPSHRMHAAMETMRSPGGTGQPRPRTQLCHGGAQRGTS